MGPPPLYRSPSHVGLIVTSSCSYIVADDGHNFGDFMISRLVGAEADDLSYLGLQHFSTLGTHVM